MAGSQKVAVVTSRLRRLVAPNEPWLSGLRAVLRQILNDRSMLIIGDGTAGADFVQHGAMRLGISCEIVVSPADLHRQDLPLRDRVLLDAADVVYVLTVRPGGNIHQLLRERLEQRRNGVILVDLPNLQPDSARKDLCELGARMWQPTPDQCIPLTCCDPLVENDFSRVNSIQDGVYLIVPFPKDDGWEMLTHTTRSCPGPWPEESFETYADSLLETRLEADHSPLQVLRRIVSHRRLIASGRTIRDGHRVVSFTACSLEHLPALHRFRPHRARWDFEPYGLCLRREWLLNRGARPVYYGNEAVWQSLPEVDRPFFQLATGDSGIDWSVEREWRHLGDVELADLTADDVLLFVPTFEAAKSLAEITAWPMTLWPGREEVNSKSQH